MICVALIKCRECEKEVSDQAQNCVHCGCPIRAQAPTTSPSVYDSPKQIAQRNGFLLSAGATVAIIIFAFLDWVSVGDRWGSQGFNLFSSWSQINELRSGMSRMFGSTPREITTLWLIISALAIAFIVTIIMLIIAFVKQLSGENSQKLAKSGYFDVIFISVAYFFLATYANDGGASVTPSIFFILTIAAAIVGLVGNSIANKDYVEISNNFSSDTALRIKKCTKCGKEFSVENFCPNCDSKDWCIECRFCQRNL